MNDVVKSAVAMMLVAMLAAILIVFTHASTASGRHVTQPAGWNPQIEAPVILPDSTNPAGTDSLKKTATEAR